MCCVFHEVYAGAHVYGSQRTTLSNFPSQGLPFSWSKVSFRFSPLSFFLSPFLLHHFSVFFPALLFQHIDPHLILTFSLGRVRGAGEEAVAPSVVMWPYCNLIMMTDRGFPGHQMPGSLAYSSFRLDFTPSSCLLHDILPLQMKHDFVWIMLTLRVDCSWLLFRKASQA